MATKKKMLQAAAGSAGGAGLDITDVFSTYLYTGDYNAGTLNQHIKNNISLGSLGSGGTSVNFNGSSYLTRSEFTGNSDGKEITFSAWILFNDYENNFVFSLDPNGGGSGINVGYFSGKLRFYAHNTSGSVISEWHVDDSNTPFHQWFHLCFSVNTASGVGATKVYINDVAATKESVSSSNQTMDRTRNIAQIGVRGTDYKLTGNLAHVYMDYTYRDLDTESNRRLFIDANGGSTDPSTLSALNPIMYCPLTDDYTMGKNLGTGGDFTTGGSPAFSTLGTEATDEASGGLVWIKNRDQTDNHMLFDTERGASKSLSSNDNNGEVTNNSDTLTQFLADGFFLGDDVAVNTNNEDYASWTFRKAPKFFDVVTWTGNGQSTQTIPHNLGSAPGFITIKATGLTQSWWSYHRSLGTGKYIKLETTGAAVSGSIVTATSDSDFTVGSTTTSTGYEYVAYVFAHNDGDGDFGDGSQDIIKCGSFTAGANVDVDVGFEPQWVLVRNSTGGQWLVVDNMRGLLALPGNSPYSRGFRVNEARSEINSQIQVTSTGFATNANAELGFSGNCIYMAIRRGPLAVPTDATKVFAPNFYGTSGYVGYLGAPADMTMLGYLNGNSQNAVIRTRMLPNNKGLVTSSTAAEITTNSSWDNMLGVSPTGTTLTTLISYTWKRAPGYFDLAAYTGNYTAGHTVSHNLGVAPEMMWVKKRDAASFWRCYHKDLGNTKAIALNDNGAAGTSTYWSNTTPTDSVFTVGLDGGTNSSGNTFIAYLFATAPGVSKVGSYTGNGSSQTIDCGFTAGARFILIKRTDSTGDWYIWDTKRGIVAGNDPHLSLNTTAAQVTTDDSIDPASSGFIVNQVSATNINVSSAEYIFYAIA